MTTITSSGFFTQVLGEVSHPINIVREYLDAFGNKCKASIITWLDSWTRTKIAQGKDIWIWERQRNLAKELGYNKETINIHLNQLIDLGIIEASLQTPNSCSRLFKYRLNIDNLSAFLAQSGFTPLNRNSVHGKTDIRTTENGIPDSNLNHSPNSNNPNSPDKYNNSDDDVVAHAGIEFEFKTQDQEPHQDSRIPDIQKPKLREKTTIPHEDQSCGAARHDATSSDAEVNNKLVEGLGVILNPKLKRFLASVTAEEVLRAIASYYYTLEVKQTTVENVPGFVIDATKNDYLENTSTWSQSSELNQNLMLLAAGLMAMGAKLEYGFYGVAVSGEIAFADKQGDRQSFNNNWVSENIESVGILEALERALQVYAKVAV